MSRLSRLFSALLVALALLNTFPAAASAAATRTSPRLSLSSTGEVTMQTLHKASTQPSDATTQDYVRVLQSDAWLRYFPSTSSSVIRTVHAGRGFHVYEEWNGWCRGYSAEDPFAVGWIPCYHLYY